MKNNTQEMSANQLFKWLSSLLSGLKLWSCGKLILNCGKGGNMEAAEYVDIQATLLELIEEIKDLKQRIENLEKEKV